MWRFLSAVEPAQWLRLLTTVAVTAALGTWLRVWGHDLRRDEPAGSAPIFRDPTHRIDPELGAALLQRVFDARWIHRRVERLSFLDEAKIRRHLSLDLEVPSSLRAVHRDGEYGRDWSVVPLALLRKRSTLDDQQVLRSLDVHDESGAAVPLLSHYDNALAAWSVLCVAVAGGRAVDELNEEERDFLWNVAACPAKEATDLVRKVLEGQLSPREYPLLVQSRNDPAVGYALKRFSGNYLLIVELGTGQDAAGERRIIKVAYDDVMPKSPWVRMRGGPLRREFWDAIGLLPRNFTFDLGTPLPSRGIHCAVEVPSDVVVVAAKLEARAPLGVGRDVVRQRAIDNRLEESPHLAHMHLSNVPLVAEVSAHLTVRSQASLAGWLAVFAPGALAAGLWFGSRSPAAVLSQAGNVQSLLLLLPGLMAGIAFARQRHHLLARLTITSRLLSASVMGVALASIVVLATVEGTGVASQTTSALDLASWWGWFARVALFLGLGQALVTLTPWSIRAPGA